MRITSNRPKIAIISSRGGHLFQMYRLKAWWNRYDHFWVTFPGDDVSSLLKNERIYYGYYPESRNVLNAIRNLLFAIKILRKEQPGMLISCGAGIAPPFFYIGKLLGIKLIFIEPYDFIAYPSLSGRLIAPIADHFLVQHKTQMRFYKNALYKGATL